MRASVLLLAAAAAATELFHSASSHGGLSFPPPRNNHGNADPRNYTLPRCERTPTHMCSTRAGGPCAGGECLWFSEGCYIGCPSCSLAMPAGGNCSDGPCQNYYGEPSCGAPELMEPTLPDEFRTGPGTTRGERPATRPPVTRAASPAATRKREEVAGRRPPGRSRATWAATCRRTKGCGRSGRHLLHMRSAG